MTREQNVGPVERWIRVIGGSTAVVVGLTLLLGGPANVLIAFGLVALTLLGFDFAVTGITGYCPLYQRLGVSTARARHKPHQV